MRIGINPEKLEPKKLIHKSHRVIIPVYIPNLEDDYFKNALEVLKICLDSLLATISLEQTNITIINNASCQEVDRLLTKYFEEGKLDKYIKLKENRGKVEPVLSEAMSSFEEYITISDADVLFRNGWLFYTMQLFDTFPKVGVVAPLPCPHLYSYCNSSCIVDNFLSRKIKYGTVVKKNTLKEFERSIGSSLMQSYYDTQYYIQKHNVKALLGAGHFIATYKNFFRYSVDKKVPYVFANGLEKTFIDDVAEKFGMWRLSTTEAYVYHMGNTIIDSTQIKKDIDNSTRFFKYKKLKSTTKIKYRIQTIFYKIIMKILKKQILKVNKCS